MLRSFSYIILLSLLLPAFRIAGQEQNQPGFELVKVRLNQEKNCIEFRLKLLNEDGLPVITPIKGDNLQITEQIEKKEPKILSILTSDTALVTRKVEVTQDTFTVTFLLDVSNRTDDTAIALAKKFIARVMAKYPLSDQSRYQLSTFSEKTHLQQAPLSIEGLEYQLDDIRQYDQNPDLYRVLIEQVQYIKEFPGKHVLFLLASGVNDARDNPLYRPRIPPDRYDVQKNLQALSGNFYIAPLALGDDPDKAFLERIVSWTPQQGDFLLDKESVPRLSNILQSNIMVESTHILEAFPQEKGKMFFGRQRKYTVELDLLNQKNKVEFPLQEGTTQNPISLARPTPLEHWIVFLLLGLAALVALLAAGSLLVPQIRRFQFRKKYVHEYKPDPKRRQIDPLTREPIQTGELVVTKCQQVTPFETWKGVGWQCPNYPDCLNMKFFQCNGRGAPENDNNFFSMQGIYRYLNWMFFGAVGGFAGWLIFALSQIIGFNAYQNLLKTAYKTYSSVAENVPDLGTIAADTLVGIAFGVGLIFMLAWVEERGQSRQISWPRILLRTGIGALITSFVFFLGVVLQHSRVIPNTYLAGLLTWLLFGLAIGLVLSIRSSIILKRGLAGGLLAGIIGFGIYIGLASLEIDFNAAKLFSLLIVGAVLGTVLVSVVSTMESFELEYLSPKDYRRTVPISKWLKSGLEVQIGSEAGSYVYIKWSDPDVQARHASLSYSKGRVYIQPLAETLVGGQIIPENKKMLLEDGDIIQLGRRSVTQLRFKGKANGQTRERSRPRGGSTVRSSAGGEDSKGRLGIQIENKND